MFYNTANPIKANGGSYSIVWGNSITWDNNFYGDPLMTSYEGIYHTNTNAMLIESNVIRHYRTQWANFGSDVNYPGIDLQPGTYGGIGRSLKFTGIRSHNCPIGGLNASLMNTIKGNKVARLWGDVNSQVAPGDKDYVYGQKITGTAVDNKLLLITCNDYGVNPAALSTHNNTNSLDYDWYVDLPSGWEITEHLSGSIEPMNTFSNAPVKNFYSKILHAFPWYNTTQNLTKINLSVFGSVNANSVCTPTSLSTIYPTFSYAAGTLYDGGPNSQGYTQDDGAYKMDNTEKETKAALNVNTAMWKPNVTQDHTVFEYTLSEKVQHPKLIIYDQMGREVFNTTLIAQKGSLNYDMQPFAAGMYFWRLQSTDVVLLAGKLVKQ